MNYNIISKIKKIISLNLDKKIKEQLYIQLFESSCLNNEIKLIDDMSDNNIIISLTTYSKRINDVFLVIESIGRQIVKANRIILWLDMDEFHINSLPAALLNQVERGLEIKFYHNIKSYKKLIPTLLANKNSNIITIDDDILYPIDFIDLLVRESKKYPNVIISNLAHKIELSETSIKPYNCWDLYTKDERASMNIFPVGAGGVYYPSGCFNAEVVNEDVFMKFAPKADDIWFKLMTSISGCKSKKVSDQRGFNDRFIPLSNSQDIALYHENVEEGLNNKQINDILSHYKLTPKIFINTD